MSGAAGLRYRQVDVFSGRPYTGNGLAVFPDRGDLTAFQMQAITGELRQFESIFLHPTGTPGTVSARIFTMEEELPFAGHPVLGAAAVLHAELAPARPEAAWHFQLAEKAVPVATRRQGGGFVAEMDQGEARFGPALDPAAHAALLAGLGLTAADLAPGLPLQVVSTGLAYLIVPVAGELGRGRIVVPDYEERLAQVGARFFYLLDPDGLEGRTWDNRGAVEDVATGSAAGPAGAYLVAHGRARPGTPITIRQGERAGRPSRLTAVTAAAGRSVRVQGEVVLVGEGVLHRLPTTGPGAEVRSG